VRLEEACANSFARHETFHPRWGWIRKAFVAAENPRVFNADDATLQLGVGKNMVRAIRFWGHAFRALVNLRDDDRPRLGLSVRSQIGTAIFDEKHGWDPFTEDPGTLWLLHWLLLAPSECTLPVWWTAFNEFGAVEFTLQDLTDFVTDQIRSVAAWGPGPHPSSIEKDISCLLRTYSPSSGTGRRPPFDDLVDCPMRELGLIRSVDPAERRYRFVVGSKSTLPPEIVLYACADFLARTESGANTVSASRLATEAGAPGRTFKLSEADLVSLLEEAVDGVESASLARPAGAVQLVLTQPAAEVATVVVQGYYQRRGVSPDADASAVLAGPAADAACDVAGVA
jgi:hypothetical protein